MDSPVSSNLISMPIEASFWELINKRLILFYTYETDLGDGWEDASVHNNSEFKRNEALKMGVNIFTYSLIQ